MPSMNYSRTGEAIDITIRDNTGYKIESHHIPMNQPEMYRKIINYIEKKYGLKPTVDIIFNKDKNSFV